MPDAPVWLQNPDMESLCRDIIRQLDKQPADQRVKPIGIRTSDPRLKTLSAPKEHGDDSVLWQTVKAAVEAGVFVIEHGRRSPGQAEHINARLRFQWGAEGDLRRWLGMPRPSTANEWHAALQEHAPDLDLEFLRDKPLYIEGKSEAEVVSRLVQAKHLLSQGQLTLRQLAARCFWAESKLFDSRGVEWVERALRLPSGSIRERKIHAAIHAPQSALDGFLFVENRDTFDLLLQSELSPPELAVVYLSGFQGAASRVRSSGASEFLYTSTTLEKAQKRIRELWYGDTDVVAYIWADLDYAGLNIGLSLQRSFPSLDWYEPGYSAMMKRLHAGEGHTIVAGPRGGQSRPSADALWGKGNEILNAIDAYQCFVDQESVLPSELC